MQRFNKHNTRTFILYPCFWSHYQFIRSVFYLEYSNKVPDRSDRIFSSAFISTDVQLKKSYSVMYSTPTQHIEMVYHSFFFFFLSSGEMGTPHPMSALVIMHTHKINCLFRQGIMLLGSIQIFNLLNWSTT